jgi:2-oxoisovalerate dehydrogenase E1 component
MYWRAVSPGAIHAGMSLSDIDPHQPQHRRRNRRDFERTQAMAANPVTLIPARHKNVNRAEVCDQNFVEFVRDWNGGTAPAALSPQPSAPVLPGSLCTVADFIDLFHSQLVSRHLDLMARATCEGQGVLHDRFVRPRGNAMVARLTRPPTAFPLPQRRSWRRFPSCPALIVNRVIVHGSARALPRADDPASGGRHKVWGGKPFGYCADIDDRRVCRRSARPWRSSRASASATSCRFRTIRSPSARSATHLANHATAQTAFNTAQWTAYQKLPAPVLFVCEDNGIGISVKTPRDWISASFSGRRDLDYFTADGLDLATGYEGVARAVFHCRTTRRPTFLHMRTTRIMGHAGTTSRSNGAASRN